MIYINRDNGSSKFWGYSCTKGIGGNVNGTNYHLWTVTYKWGRIGISLDNAQSKTDMFTSEYQAKQAIQRKLNEKQSKGYEPLHTSYDALLSSLGMLTA